jgi:beta-1,4-mannooligosaccharide/beta-1,4-mannosyl-N-acetylglucosamine phosphorylase
MSKNTQIPVKRYEQNPILTASQIPYPATLIFNAGVTKFQGKYVMAFRNDYGGTPGKDYFAGTNLGIAYSDDGINFEPCSTPWIEWKDEEVLRVYDPRLTTIDGRCYMCFAMDTRHGLRGGVAVTDDFDKWEVLHLTTPDNRNMVLFPEKLNGKYMRLERPFPIYSRGGGEKFDLWFGDSPDLRYWGNFNLVLATEQVPYAGDKIGPGAPPIKTDKGWLTLFHTVRIDPSVELSAWHSGWHKTYEIGLMLLDKDEPWKVASMLPTAFMSPETEYERTGFRGDVLFPGGMILEDSGEVKIYYGAADTVECLATASIDDLLSLMDREGIQP